MQGNNSEKMILEESLSKPQITSFENDELKNNINQINSEEEKFLKIQSILSINQNQKNYEPEPGLFKDIDDKSEKDFPKEHENQNTDLNLLSESDINKTVIIDESYPFVPKLHVISRSQKYSNKYFDYERFKDKPLSQSLGLSGCHNNNYFNLNKNNPNKSMIFFDDNSFNHYNYFNLNKNNPNNSMIFSDDNSFNNLINYPNNKNDLFKSHKYNSSNNLSNYLNNNRLSKEFENLLNLLDKYDDRGISYINYNNSFIQKFEFDNNKQKKLNQIEIKKESSGIKINPTLENVKNIHSTPLPPSKSSINSQDNNCDQNKNTSINNNLNIEKSNNNININEQISDKNELEIFNYITFKAEYKKKYKNYKFKEPPFINLEHILDDNNNKSMIENLSKNGILIEKKNLSKIKEGIIFKNLANFLEHKKKEGNTVNQSDYSSITIIRIFMPDNMSTKIKTFLSNQIIVRINSFEEMEKKILVLKAELINKQIKGDFNYIYLDKNIYSIISNDSKYNNYDYNYNYKIVSELLQKNKAIEEPSEIVEFLKLKVKDVLDIIRYKSKIDDKTNIIKKLDSFLISQKNIFRDIPKRKKEVKNLDYFIKSCKEKLGYDENKILEDYICSLLLLTFNLERFFYLRKPRGFKKKKIKNLNDYH